MMHRHARSARPDCVQRGPGLRRMVEHDQSQQLPDRRFGVGGVKIAVEVIVPQPAGNPRRDLRQLFQQLVLQRPQRAGSLPFQLACQVSRRLTRRSRQPGVARGEPRRLDVAVTDRAGQVRDARQTALDDTLGGRAYRRAPS